MRLSVRVSESQLGLIAPFLPKSILSENVQVPDKSTLFV